MFVPFTLTENDQMILAAFFHKRALFDNYIKDNNIKIFTCPGCAYPTLPKRGEYEICIVCNWEDDLQDDGDADRVKGGPNGRLSLTENRVNIGNVLNNIAESLNSKVSLDASYVLNQVEISIGKQSEVGSSMTGDEKLESPIWEEWRQVEEELIFALIKG